MFSCNCCFFSSCQSTQVVKLGRGAASQYASPPHQVMSAAMKSNNSPTTIPPTQAAAITTVVTGPHFVGTSPTAMPQKGFTPSSSPEPSVVINRTIVSTLPVNLAAACSPPTAKQGICNVVSSQRTLSANQCGAATPIPSPRRPQSA
jgi:hypothetical protein